MLARVVRAKNWVFTINNFEQSDEDAVVALSEKDGVVRMIAEHEFDGDNGTPHIQGYVSFAEKVNRNWLEIWLGGRAYIAEARGGWRQNWRYCSKEENVFVCLNSIPSDGDIFGNETISNKVTAAALNACKTMDPRQFMDEFPNIWFYHADKVKMMMTEYALQKMKDWDGELQEKNFWIWGAPGIGKSQWVSKQMSMTNIYKKNCNKWWDGYSLISHNLVAIEDYPCLPQGNMLSHHMKIWADRYVFQGECKGSHVCVQPGRFFLIVTSNYPIEMCFETPEDQAAIARRFHEIHMTAENKLMMDCLRLDSNILET